MFAVVPNHRMKAMMNSCPACGSPGIRPAQKLSATMRSPLRCEICGALLAVRPSAGWWAFTSVSATVVGFIGLAGLFLYGWWTVIAAMIAIFGINAAMLWLSPLQTTDPRAVRRGRRTELLAVAIFLLAVLLTGLFY